MRRAAIGLGGAIAGVVLALLGWRLLDERAAPPIVIEDPLDSGTLTVAIQGAVATPGLYVLGGSARVQDAVLAAGGTTADADLASINPARRLRDEDLIVVARRPLPGIDPASTEAAIDGGATPGVPDPGGADAPQTTIDLNQATVLELDRLPGIDPTLAQRIVDYRTANGPFRTIEALAEVQGISPRMVQDLRPFVTVAQ